MSTIDRLEHEWKQLHSEAFPVSDEDRIDLAGRLNALASKMQNHKRALLSEIDQPISGMYYRIATSRKATRSYSTSAILSTFTEAGWDLHDLLREDAVRLTWRWTELKRAFNQAGAVLRLASREIEDDGDVTGPHVGEHWTDEVKLEGVEF